MRFHLGAAVVVLAAAVLGGVTPVELAVLLVTITLVLTAELFNTAAEAIVDLVSPETAPTGQNCQGRGRRRRPSERRRGGAGRAGDLPAAGRASGRSVVGLMELCRAPAKINLALEILGRRPDGFHEIASVIQAVGLYDELRVAPAETLRFTCDRSALASADNLVVRAARALQNATGCRRGTELRLYKGIPVAAGLGGGSSDAAAALVLLNRHWHLGLTLGELSRIGATLGSDIPFFLTGPTAVVSGRGERVELLPPPPLGWVVLVRPRQPLSTAVVYGALRPEQLQRRPPDAPTRRGPAAGAAPRTGLPA